MNGDFTLSYHYYTQHDRRNHLELFLDTDGISELETWRSYGKQSSPRRFEAAPPHRRVYLEFSGALSNHRGRLRIMRRGKFIDRRTRGPEACAVQNGHLGADQQTVLLGSSTAREMPPAAGRTTASIKVTL